MSSCWAVTSKSKWILWPTIPVGPCFTVINNCIWTSDSWRFSITRSASWLNPGPLIIRYVERNSSDSLELRKASFAIDADPTPSCNRVRCKSLRAASSGGFAGSRLAQSESIRFSRQLPIPPLIDAARQRGAVKLKVTSGRHAFVKGKPTRSYGYSGPVLGPAIRLRRGDEVEMAVENALDVDTTVHWHGLLVPGEADGGPHQVIKSGSKWRTRLEIEQPASTAWFHPHLHHDTARQVYMGLSGLIIVDDGSDAGLGRPTHICIDDLPLILQDRSFDSDGSLHTISTPIPSPSSMAPEATPSSSMA